MHQILTSGRDVFIRYKANAGFGLVQLASHDNYSNPCGVVCVCARSACMCVYCVCLCV